MSTTDYTLPFVPKPDGPPVLDGYHECDMLDYGHACAEAARTPLLARLRSVCQALVEAVGADGPCDAEAAAARAVARITELEADLREYIHGSAVVAETLKHAVTDRDRLRTEVEALRNSLRECELFVRMEGLCSEPAAKASEHARALLEKSDGL